MSAITEAVRHTRRGVRLADIDPSSTPGFTGDKVEGRVMLAERADRLADLQERLFADSKAGGGQSVLLLLQGMDTSGKGGLVRHVVGEVDPQGVRITSFKAPTRAERRHDFLWRIERQLPQPGQIGVFDRSHYEEVLIHRVRGLSKPEVIEERYARIVEFERGLVDRGIHLVKVMPHISYGMQGERLLERLDRPEKHWKYNTNDVDERTFWPHYMEAYQVAINRTARAAAPWHVVPADRKWFARLAVQDLLIEALESIDPQWPVADFDVEVERGRLLTLGGIPDDALAASEALSGEAGLVAEAEVATAKKAKKAKKAARTAKAVAKTAAQAAEDAQVEQAEAITEAVEDEQAQEQGKKGTRKKKEKDEKSKKGEKSTKAGKQDKGSTSKKTSKQST